MLKRQRVSWDFALTVATVALLGALGVQSLVGTLYAWWAYRTQPGWEASGYPVFVSAMNAVAAPLAIALVVVMGLCVPKRLFTRSALIAVSLGGLGLGAAAWALTGSLRTGLAAYLAVSALLQVAVVLLTVTGAGGLRYLTESGTAKAGSGLLHLGFIVFALTVVALQSSPLMLPAFLASALLLTGGSALSFYARRAPSEASGSST
ncbi:hypothetical protein MX659_01655 [Coriobacteriia bacterium Es71-Z0120]|uniref:hypothetical protein n=1 Tax=Parvivirga hydrogeniphila TaxID=2939460 RepID=UPI0022608BFD|nr:hypothetical protein [Parvivirga hydrogeniphila]MCL4078312.1 hypothetical protein [Parvivirga hydrogeniphila]